MRILGVAETDSYVKWGAATLGRAPADWERSFVVVRTPLLPTSDQLRAAVDGLPGDSAPPEILDLDELRARVAVERPDVVFLALRGPLIRVVLRTVLEASEHRPVIVSGLPGISIPATKKALTFRSQVDLMLLHSKREIRDFTELAVALGLEQEFGLATLPFLRTASPVATPRLIDRDEILFAVQAKVPHTRSDRAEIVAWLAECARRHPDVRVVVKLRATGDEKQTHAELYPYDELLSEIQDRPDNLVAETGSMAWHLARAVGLVTLSSTALIEAVAAGVPGLALDDFGVSRRLINPVFEDSNLFGSSGDLIGAQFRTPSPEWLDENYFHAETENDWIDRLSRLVAENALAPLPLRRERYGRTGGRLRHIWDRKRALGQIDRTVIGRFALVVGHPARATLMTARRVRRIGRRVLRGRGAQVPSESLETSPQPRSPSSSSTRRPRVP